jgi:hypothetical protein
MAENQRIKEEQINVIISTAGISILIFKGNIPKSSPGNSSLAINGLATG